MWLYFKCLLDNLAKTRNSKDMHIHSKHLAAIFTLLHGISHHTSLSRKLLLTSWWNHSIRLHPENNNNFDNINLRKLLALKIELSKNILEKHIIHRLL
jgi:phosphomevalonate kinase